LPNASAPGMPKEIAPRKVPRGERRREELIDVAEKIFLERGFPETTMQMIAEAAGASKETLYRHFESKEFLFAEIVSRKARLISGPDGAIARGGSPEVVLSALGTSLLRTIATGHGSFLFRTVVGEAARSPELGDLFYDRGPGLTVERLTQYLADATKRGELSCDDPLVAARLYLGAVAAQFHLRRLLQSKWKPPTASEIERHVKAAVSMFLAEFGAR
jgi:TetR/AcrR family transcriptional regulator, mexJK operon transcriptional repressor